MIQVNVLARVFRIKVGLSQGSCFTIDVDNRQYLITARHIIDGWDEIAPLQIFHNRDWVDIPLTLVGKCDGEIDIAVLSPKLQLSRIDLKMPATAHGLTWGQDVYFLGFPYGWYGDVGEINGGFPSPFVKKAIVSCMSNEINGKFILDGNNNPGFSGGPVVYKYMKEPDGLYRVASVISGYRASKEPIFSGESKTSLEYEHNTGIIISYSIGNVLEIIKENPIGYKISS